MSRTRPAKRSCGPKRLADPLAQVGALLHPLPFLQRVLVSADQRRRRPRGRPPAPPAAAGSMPGAALEPHEPPARWRRAPGRRIPTARSRWADNSDRRFPTRSRDARRSATTGSRGREPSPVGRGGKRRPAKATIPTAPGPDTAVGECLHHANGHFRGDNRGSPPERCGGRRAPAAAVGGAGSRACRVDRLRE